MAYIIQLLRHSPEETAIKMTVDEKLAFVSGLTGGSVWEIYLVFLTTAFGLMIRNIGLICSSTIQDWHRSNVMLVYYIYT